MCSVSYAYILFANNEAVEVAHGRDGGGPQTGLADARPLRRPAIALELKVAVGDVEEAVLPVEEQVTEVCHCHRL